MKKIVLTLFSFCVLSSLVLAQTSRNYVGGGGNGTKLTRQQNWNPQPTNVFDVAADTYTIGVGSYSEVDGNITLTCSLVVNGTLQGNQSKTITIASGGVLIINGSGSLLSNSIFTINDGGVMINNGTLDIDGTINVNGTLTNTDNATVTTNGTVSVGSTGNFTNEGTLTIDGGTVSTTGTGQFNNPGTVNQINGGSLNAQRTFATNTTLDAGAYYTSATIQNGATVTLNGGATFADLTMTSGSLAISTDTLFLGTFTGFSSTNVISTDGSASIQFDGAQTGSIFLDQTTTGTTNRFEHFILNNASANITLGNATEISGVLTPTSGGLTTSGNLTLVSTGQSAYAQVAIGSGTISGNVTYQMYMVGGYQQIGTAVGTSIQDLAETGNYLDGSVFTWNSASSSWVAVDSASNPSLTAGQGLFAYFGNAGGGFTYSFNTPGALNLTGALNAGNYTSNLTYHDGTGTNASFYQNGDSAGWNFLSNPYPSQLDWNQVSIPTNTNSAIYIYKASDQTYTAYTQGAGSGTNGGTRYIAPMQGFFIQVEPASSGESIGFTNAQRTVQNTATPTFFKNGVPEQLNLEIESVADGKKDETIIQFNAASTKGFDGKFDAVKFFNGGANPNIYTSDSTGKTYSINCLPTFDSNYSHPIAFKLHNTTGSEFTLRIAQKQSMEGWRIYLEDTYNNTYHELHNSEYTFTVDDKDQDLQDRFIVHYVKAEENTGFMKAVAASAFKIYQTPQTVHLDVVNDEVDVEIVDLMGRVVTPSTSYELGNHEIKLPTNGHTQIYIIRVSNEKETQSLKVIR